MKYNAIKHNFKSFIKRWSSDNEYLLFGKSKECFQFIRTIDHLLPQGTLKILGIMDFEQNTIKSYNSMRSAFPYYYNAKYNKEEELNKREITLFPADEFTDIKKVKIIVTTDLHRQKAVNYLKNRGLKEDINYCIYKKIAGIWPLMYNNLAHLYRVDQTLTTKCSLNCTYCNMYMPYYQKQSNLVMDNLISDVDILFNKIDFISTYHLIGGEPFLHPDIDKIIEHIGENYRDKIDNLTITTNGTRLPRESTLDLMRKYEVYVGLSDYTKSLPKIKNKVKNVINKFRNSGIYLIVKEVNEWNDFGDLRIQLYKDEKSVIDHFDKCTAQYRGITDKKFYYCNLSMSADASGIHPNQSGDYIHLDGKISKEDIIKFDLGFTPKGYISLCKNCNGCNTDINIPVTPKEQGLRNIQDILVV